MRMFTLNSFCRLGLLLACWLLPQLTAAANTCSTSICVGAGQTCTISATVDFYLVPDSENCVLNFGSKNVQITGNLSNEAPLDDDFYSGTLEIVTQGNIAVTGSLAANALTLGAGGLVTIDASRGVGRVRARNGALRIDAGLGISLLKNSELAARDSDEVVLSSSAGGISLGGVIKSGGSQASIEIVSKRDFSLLSTGSLWVGDDSSDDSTKNGGSVSIVSEGLVTIAGSLSTNSENSGGPVEITAKRDLSIVPGAKISSFATGSGEDRSEIYLTSQSGAVSIGGEIKVGLNAFVTANNDLALVKGGKFYSLSPGKIEFESVNGSSVIGGLVQASTPATGGQIEISAKSQISISSDAEIVASAQVAPPNFMDDLFFPGGGAIEIRSESGEVSVAGPIRANGPESGGTVEIYARDGDISVDSLIEARAFGNGIETEGGSINFRDKDGRHQDREGNISLGTKGMLSARAAAGVGGAININSACDLKLDGALDVAGGATSRGGSLSFEYRRGFLLNPVSTLLKAGILEDELYVWCREKPDAPGVCASYPVDVPTGRSLQDLLPMTPEKVADCLVKPPNLPAPYVNEPTIECDDRDYCTHDYKTAAKTCAHSPIDSLMSPQNAACNLWNSRDRLHRVSCSGACGRELQRIDGALTRLAQHFILGSKKRQQCRRSSTVAAQLGSYVKYLGKSRTEDRLSEAKTLDYLRSQALQALSRAGALKAKYCRN